MFLHISNVEVGSVDGVYTVSKNAFGVFSCEKVFIHFSQVMSKCKYSQMLVPYPEQSGSKQYKCQEKRCFTFLCGV